MTRRFDPNPPGPTLHTVPFELEQLPALDWEEQVAVDELLRAAGSAARPSEQRGEFMARQAFRRAMAETPPERAPARLPRVPVAAASLIGVVVSVAGLSAAAVLPPVLGHHRAVPAHRVALAAITPGSAVPTTAGPIVVPRSSPQTTAPTPSVTPTTGAPAPASTPAASCDGRGGGQPPAFVPVGAPSACAAPAVPPTTAPPASHKSHHPPPSDTPRPTPVRGGNNPVPDTHPKKPKHTHCGPRDGGGAGAGDVVGSAGAAGPGGGGGSACPPGGGSSGPGTTTTTPADAS